MCLNIKALLLRVPFCAVKDGGVGHVTECGMTNPGELGSVWTQSSLCPTLSSTLQSFHLPAFFLLILSPAVFFFLTMCLQPARKQTMVLLS